MLHALSKWCPALSQKILFTFLHTGCKLNSIAEDTKALQRQRRVFLSPVLFTRLTYFSFAHCVSYTSCVERSDKREKMEVGGWHWGSILKGTWQNSNNLLGSPSSALSYLRLAISVSNRELARPIYCCPTCTWQVFTCMYVCMYICICMWLSREHRGEKCQAALPELESGEIQAGKIRDWAIDLASEAAYGRTRTSFFMYVNMMQNWNLPAILIIVCVT